MAYTLSATLAAHQKKHTRNPSVRLTLKNTRGGIPVLRWSRLYAGPEPETDNHAVTVADDGSLIRARSVSGTLYVSRVPSPGPTSPFSAWTSLGAMFSGGAVALASKAGELLLVYQSASDTLSWRTSSDDGATWSGATAMPSTETAAVNSVAVAYETNGDACVFVTLSGSVRRRRRAAGVWAATSTAWTNTITTATGVAAAYNGADYIVAVTGTATTSHRYVWACLFGNGGIPANNWSSLIDVAQADAASTTTFAGPAVVQFTGQGMLWYCHQESAAPAYNRAFMAYPAPPAAFNSRNWSEPAPHEATATKGLAVATYDGDQVWAATPAGVWSSRVYPSTDLSARLLACSVEQAPYSLRGRLTLANADGVLTPEPPGGAPSAYPALRRGSTLEIEPGYLSNAGAAEYGLIMRTLIAAVTHEVDRRKGSRQVILDLIGPWERAARWRAPQAWNSPAGALTRGQLFARVAAKAGVFGTDTGAAGELPSSAWTTYTPAFSYAPGDAGDDVLRRILGQASEAVRAEQGDLTVVSPPSAVAEAYGGSYRATVRQDSPASYWRLGEAATATAAVDEQGAANGTYTGNPARGYAGLLTNDPDGAVFLNGTDDYVAVSDVYDFAGLAPFTLEAVIRPFSLIGSNRVVVAKVDAAVSGWSFFVDTGRNLTLIRLNAGAGPSATGPVTLFDATTYHVAATYDGTSMVVYVNGLPGVAVASSTSVPNTTEPLAIGRNFFGNYFSGAVDEVAVYSAALTAAQIAAHAEAAIADFRARTWHPLYAFAERDGPPAANWTRLTGIATPPPYAQAFDLASVYADGPLLRQARSLDATSSAKASDYAVQVHAQANRQDPAGQLVVPWDAARQLHDRVSVTDPLLALAGKPYRVLGVRLDYERGPTGKARYEATLTLGGT